MDATRDLDLQDHFPEIESQPVSATGWPSSKTSWAVLATTFPIILKDLGNVAEAGKVAKRL
jgi:hypothetical protein